MTQQPAPSTTPASGGEQEIIQRALEKLRSILKGNGIKTDSVSVAAHKISKIHMNAGTYLELRPASSERTSPGKLTVGQMVQSREDAARAVDQAMIQAANDSAIKAQIASMLLSRPDQGFGLSRQTIPLDFLKREYTWHERCNTCNGTSRSSCQRCHGRRLESCIKCSGRGLMACPLCRTTGMLQGQKCNRCQGQRYVPCDQCQRSGMMSCRMCNASGTTSCPTCNGQGSKTHTITASAQAVTYFEYDGKNIPKHAADMIETKGGELVKDQRISVQGRVADENENVLGANYEVEFPHGEIIFLLGKKEIRASIFGLKGELIHFPDVLDRIVAPAIRDLEDAARDVGNVANKIRRATRYRVVAQGFMLASKSGEGKAAERLLKLYDIGLSQGAAEKIIHLADVTTSRITRKPRYYGLVAGLGLVGVMGYIYYMFPVRSRIAAYLPDVRLDFILDLLPLVLGGIITMMCIQFAASGSIKKALGHLSRTGATPLVPKTRSSGLWGWLGTGTIMIGLMEYASSRTTAAPYWYEIVRNIFAQIIG